jgi:hypothetical protein
MRRAIQAAVLVLLLLVVAGFFAVYLRHLHVTSSRTQCISNLKQIAIAAHIYHDTYKRFPQGTVPSDLPPEQRLSWLTEIWPPFMEGGIMTRFDKTKPWNAPGNNPPVYLVRDYPENGGEPVFNERVFDVVAFLCPANPVRGGGDQPCYTHYVGIAGVGEAAAEPPLSDPTAGFFGYDRTLTMGDMKRGLGAILMLAEVGKGGPWMAGGRTTVRGLDASDLAGGWSCHGDAHFAFADGSVRPLRGSLSPTVFEALAAIAGNDVGPP